MSFFTIYATNFTYYDKLKTYLLEHSPFTNNRWRVVEINSPFFFTYKDMSYTVVNGIRIQYYPDGVNRKLDIFMGKIMRYSNVISDFGYLVTYYDDNDTNNNKLYYVSNSQYDNYSLWVNGIGQLRMSDNYEEIEFGNDYLSSFYQKMLNEPVLIYCKFTDRYFFITVQHSLLYYNYILDNYPYLPITKNNFTEEEVLRLKNYYFDNLKLPKYVNNWVIIGSLTDWNDDLLNKFYLFENKVSQDYKNIGIYSPLPNTILYYDTYNINEIGNSIMILTNEEREFSYMQNLARTDNLPNTNYDLIEKLDKEYYINYDYCGIDMYSPTYGNNIDNKVYRFSLNYKVDINQIIGATVFSNKVCCFGNLYTNFMEFPFVYEGIKDTNNPNNFVIYKFFGKLPFFIVNKNYLQNPTLNSIDKMGLFKSNDNYYLLLV